MSTERNEVSVTTSSAIPGEQSKQIDAEVTVKEFIPATQGQKITLAVILAVATVVVVAGCAWVLYQLESASNGIAEVRWANPKGLRLKSGPASFWHDPNTQKVLHRGAIDDQLKVTLAGLDETGDQDFRAAIDELTFASQSQTRASILWVLLLGGFGGFVGVQIRSVQDFIGNACYKKSLDVVTWWPWYAVRPLLGFLLGALVVVLVKADLLAAANKGSDQNLWWVGLAVIAGFGVVDVIARLRLLSKTLFGADKSD